MNLAEKIRIIRKARGYSQEELGYELKKSNPNGISRQSVSDWENSNSEPKLDNIRDLAKVLNVSYDTLLDENIDLNNSETLNIALKNLSKETKEKVNSSYRYRIYNYAVKRSDYIKLGAYCFFLAVSIVFLIVSLCIYGSGNGNAMWMIFISVMLLSSCLATIALPIQRIKRIKRGHSYSSFGTLSATHFVVIGLSDDVHDKTIYVPVKEIESMELAPGATERHGQVIVHIKDRSKPLVTNDIVKPKELIKEFNNLEYLQEF